MKRRSKKHLFLWLRNRTTENRKGKKAQNIKGKWQSKNFRQGSILVPRLAINEKYKRYSPGLILCNEIIKECYRSGKIRCLNLLRGTEKYKYDLGGKTYITKNLKIDLRGIYNDEAETGVSS